jgi:hypothetical protein
MQRIAELTLPQLMTQDPQFAADPFAQFAAARKQHPWLAQSPFGYVITEYAAIKDLLGMDEKLRVAHEGMIELMNAQGSKWGDFQRSSIFASVASVTRRSAMCSRRCSRRVRRISIAG